MNEHFVIQSVPSIVSEPDYVGPNGTLRSPIKMFFALLIVSIAICAIAMNLLAASTLIGHVFWLIFHVLYLGGLVYYFYQKWKLYKGAEV